MTPYLMTFFETLGSLTERKEYDVSNGGRQCLHIPYFNR